MIKRIVRRPVPDTSALPDHLHPLLRRIYAARQVRDAAGLDYSLGALLPYERLSGIGAAADLLVEMIETGRRILIVADYDADGASACALAVRALRLMGAKDVQYVVPNRFDFGYGLTPEIVAVAAGRQPDLLITVDNGIASCNGVAEAHRRGLKVLITDHHLPGAELPAADAIVNPNLPGDPFPSKHLAGVGVMFYVLIALRARLRERGWFARRDLAEPNLAQLLDLVALGTVADVVPLDHNNRILISQGLARLRRGCGNPGMAALFSISGRDPARALAADLAYAVAPRLNAAGRLADMTLGIECLLADDPNSARALAARLDALNHERRDLQATMQQDIEPYLRDLEINGCHGAPGGICLYRDEWHQGLIGVLAARVKDRLECPVIAFAPAGDGDEIKGSARSVPGVHVRDVLAAVATREPELIGKFGGHAMAAGLTIRRARLEEFAAVFDAEVRRWLDGARAAGEIPSDGALDPGELTPEVAELVVHGGPWGQGFPEPVFDGVFAVTGLRVVADRHLRMMLRPVEGDRDIPAIAFGHAGHDWPQGASRVEIAYRLAIDHYQGRRRLQLVVEHLALA
jgi:single-stranded-DNA-specific exonuclease